MTGIMCAQARKAWDKAAIVPGLDEALWRMAVCGQPVSRDAFRSVESGCGWRVAGSQIIALAPLGSRKHVEPVIRLALAS
jgi:hypothetical protein